MNRRPARTEFLPFALPWLGEEEINEVVDTLRSGWLTLGPKTKRFEAQFAEYVGAKHAVAVNSNTSGLLLSLAALGVGDGDEVIVPSLTFAATANVVLHVGAKPVLVDCRDDFLIDPAAIEAAITPRTRAIMPVHYAGQPVDLDEIHAIAARHGLHVVEDAAHAVGVAYRGRQIGAQSPATVFSFYANKNLTTGEGGMVTLNDDALAERMRRLALHGMSRDAWKRFSEKGAWYYEVHEAGYKMNMTDLQASIGIHQLGRLAGFNARRAEIAKRFNEGMSSLPLDLPVHHADREHNWHLYVVRLDLDRLAIDRARFITELAERNIGVSVHYLPVHMHPFYRDTFGYAANDLPVAKSLYERIISLPLYPRMSDTDVDDVVDAVRQVAEQFAA